MRKPETESIPDRLKHAWGPLRGSFSLVGLGVVGVGGAFAWLFKLRENLEKWHLWPDWAPHPALNYIFGVLGVLFVARAIFLLAEECGELQEKVEIFGKTCELKNAQIERDGSRFMVLVQTIRDSVHDMREEMLSDDGFLHLLGLQGEDSIKRLWLVVEHQLARCQFGLRSLTDSYCNVSLKIVKKSALGDKDGLVTVCCGPATPVERRENSRILPIDLGLAAEALISRDIVYTNDILKDDRFWPKAMRLECSKFYRTIAVSPIVAGKVARGVLCFDWQEPEMFSDRCRPAIAAFTDVINTAFYVSILANQLASERKALPKI